MSQLWSNAINSAIAAGRLVSNSYKPTESRIKILENGAIYFKSDMDTDADGSPRALEIDPYGQLGTSLNSDNGWQGSSDNVNAETIPYFVLPLNFASVSGITCKLGDLGLIRWQGREVFAIYADQGPKNKIGEGSIKLVESLGENPWNASKTKIISGIEFGVEYLIFPRSIGSQPIPSSFAAIQTVGLKIFQRYFDDVSLPPPSVIHPLWPGRYITLTSPNATGSDVLMWQRQMIYRGWNISPTGTTNKGDDGVFSEDDYNVLIKFQKQKGLEADGKIGPISWNAAWELPVTSD
jgi:hypothetical protein